jgi:hypothetical protein
MKRFLILMSMTASLAVFIGCTEKPPAIKPTETVSSTEPPVKKPTFIPPTAEQAYRLQDDCTRRGEAVLRQNVIGSALTQEAVGRYNASTNRCYVRLEVHAADLTKWQDLDSSIYLKDGQTGELLAYVTTHPNRVVTFLGFGCDITGNPGCVEDKISDCMRGKECDPQ